MLAVVDVNHSRNADLRKLHLRDVVKHIQSLYVAVTLHTSRTTWSVVVHDKHPVMHPLIIASGDSESFSTFFVKHGRGLICPYCIRVAVDADGRFNGVEVAPAYFDVEEKCQAYQVYDESEWVRVTQVSECTIVYSDSSGDAEDSANEDSDV